MAVFGCLTLVAGVEGAVEYEAAAHAGTHEETDDVFVAAADTEMILAQDAQIHVVADEERDSELLAHGGSYVIIPPGEVGCKEHDSPILVNHAGRAGSDGVQFFPVDAGFTDHFLNDADDNFFHIRRS